LEGLAVLRAAQLSTTPLLLCVVDGTSTGGLGGTRASLERWQRRIGNARIVDLRALRERELGGSRGEAGRPAAGAGLDAVSAKATAPAGATAVAATRPPRTLKTMVFADFSGSSRIHDAAAPRFQETFWRVGAKQIEECPVKPLFASTWGDALYAVFESPIDGARFALRFLDGMREVDWIALGLGHATPIRIAVHTGPVFCGHDPIIDRDNYFGSSVTQAARIEPVTPAGMVYASEAFAATLAATGDGGFAPEYVGLVQLAKDYGESRIYRLDRR
ncbi:MAG TPA: adenylate/guanylate cyclase domain-containing protein, partial [Casimicrobiaceae bacterium]|nr:adenylate/guanylate cyclase domain-containing protein [Casimicrobiaceae bacterium]